MKWVRTVDLRRWEGGGQGVVGFGIVAGVDNKSDREVVRCIDALINYDVL